MLPTLDTKRSRYHSYLHSGKIACNAAAAAAVDLASRCALAPGWEMLSGWACDVIQPGCRSRPPRRCLPGHGRAGPGRAPTPLARPWDYVNIATSLHVRVNRHIRVIVQRIWSRVHSFSPRFCCNTSGIQAAAAHGIQQQQQQQHQRDLMYCLPTTRRAGGKQVDVSSIHLINLADCLPARPPRTIYTIRS